MANEDHRQAAESALNEAQRNKILSAEQWFRAAEVHALLAIESQLDRIAARADRSNSALARWRQVKA
jgi:hypothetical protein